MKRDRNKKIKSIMSEIERAEKKNNFCTEIDTNYSNTCPKRQYKLEQSVK